MYFHKTSNMHNLLIIPLLSVILLISVKWACYLNAYPNNEKKVLTIKQLSSAYSHYNNT